PPRETNWLIGLLLLFVILAFGATGYLLPWDQWAYWTVTEMLDGLAGLPLVAVLVDVAKGDVIVS
ncbi:MAG: cytochrome b6, partial [Gemmatimonadetes bacterium]|nr:cytochrome b6 [Gemmatimonadota bacterium]NIS03425.1 cytochrome b6 [Gemmatimonadota bacterium]NIT68799.1 cytochrome b6 [Gemmatimonadota bacterium]NIU54765.1 cytochrome b6 [Gemmatimonadota bacterium]NIV25762.1 cytochrome b6 [Gemmatimonadota bacterium]